MSKPASRKRGLRCTKCDGDQLRVLYTRRAPGGRIMRRRECLSCEARFTTAEGVIGPCGGQKAKVMTTGVTTSENPLSGVASEGSQSGSIE